MGAPFDPGLPFLDPDAVDKQSGFAQFGGPHVLTTVAGACTTVLKGWFDHGWRLPYVFEPAADGSSLSDLRHSVEPLSVEGELNKLATNIAIGRNWAGVHYYSDFIESIRLGERIALGLLEEQKVCYGETWSLSVPLHDGTVVRI